MFGVTKRRAPLMEKLRYSSQVGSLVGSLQTTSCILRVKCSHTCNTLKLLIMWHANMSDLKCHHFNSLLINYSNSCIGIKKSLNMINIYHICWHFRGLLKFNHVFHKPTQFYMFSRCCVGTGVHCRSGYPTLLGLTFGAVFTLAAQGPLAIFFSPLIVLWLFSVGAFGP